MASTTPKSTARKPVVSKGTKAASQRILGADLPPAKPLLRPTELPGVYLNGDGMKVDEAGVLLSLSSLRVAEEAKDEEVLGEPVKTPAQLLKRIALDPSLSLSTRMGAAIAAAPYFDRKMPLALEGGDPDRPVKTEQSVLIRNLNALSAEERKAALALLERLGVLQ